MSIPEHLAFLPWYAPHQAWLIQQYGSSPHRPPEDTLPVKANLSSADLRFADLSSADLRFADLRSANLSSANLNSANLSSANLNSADLSSANLNSADLRFANLNSADLRFANLSSTSLPAPPMVLSARWGECSPTLTTALMRYDAACHPDAGAFDKWAQGGPCPYGGVRIQRAANFKESRKYWVSGPSDRPHDLMMAVLREHCKMEEP